ncbi:acyl carrier protein [Rufibacter sp. LB8]|uniref:acyl carrier protein n=1 Tax=Rufibacter sp. LB8 TaxID=2777781 RepID=UPI00178C2534|nr:acyl carrier protein [Rufibacter sp. LB8]
MITAERSSIARKVITIISNLKKIRPARLKPNANLSQDFGFDTFDLVSVIWELEKRFKIEIPDEVPLNTVGDVVAYVSSQLQGRR